MSADRGGFGLLEELGYQPVNRYLPPRDPPEVARKAIAPDRDSAGGAGALQRLIDAAKRFAVR